MPIWAQAEFLSDQQNSEGGNLSKEDARLAARLAGLLETFCGISTTQQQFSTLLHRAAALVPEGQKLETYALLLTADANARQHFIERMCTHETRFFRHPDQFAAVEEGFVRARLDQPGRTIRAWSVACSSGEEPFSLGMMLLDSFPASLGWHVEVLATDVSSQVLERARRATWPMNRAANISPERLERYMLRGAGEQTGYVRAAPVLRKAVSFQRLNLIAPPYQVPGEFDLVFLRNVLIYFSPATRRLVVENIVRQMKKGAWLVTGPSEGVRHLGQGRLRAVQPHIFVCEG